MLRAPLLALAAAAVGLLGEAAYGQQFLGASPALAEDPFFTLPEARVGEAFTAAPDFFGPQQSPSLWDDSTSYCAEASDCCGPLWTVRASAVFMERTGSGSEPFRFDFDHEPGIDLSVIRQLGPCYDIELRYLGIYDWEAELDFLGAVSRNLSELHSTEINLRRRLGRMNLLAGFRWVEFMDEMRLEIPFPPIATGANINNHLYGAQIGLDGTLWDNGCRFRLDSFLKAGLFYNHIDRESFVAIGPPINFFASVVDSADKTAFLGELGVIGVYELNDRWAVRGGYQMLWLEGVALGPDLSFPLQTDGIFAHGAVAGVEWTY